MFQYMTPMVGNIIFLNVLVFLIELFFPEIINLLPVHKSNLFGLHDTVNIDGRSFILLPSGEYDPFSFEPYQILTSFFSHGGLMHIVFNMMALASLGPPVEMVLGRKRFFEFYFFSGAVGVLLCAFLDPSPNPVLGASGAISGVMLAYGLLFPQNKLMIMFIPYPFPARKLMIGIAVISMGLFLYDTFYEKGATGNISHFGHLAGMFAALVYLYGKSYWLRFQENRRR